MTCRIVYHPDCSVVPQGELTGLVRMPSTPWDQPNTWWLDCLVTYETEPPRTEGLVLPVILSDPAVDVIQEAGRILATWCVVAAVVCHLRPPMTAGTIRAIQEYNAPFERARCRRNAALARLGAAMAKAHDENVRRRSVGLLTPDPRSLTPVKRPAQQLELAIR